LPPLSDETITSFVGNGVAKLVERSIADAPQLDFPNCLEIMKEYYVAHSTDYTTPYPDVIEGLSEFKKQGFVVCVFTNKFTDAAQLILDKLGLGKFLDEIIGSDSGFPLKPEPEAILYLMDKYHFSTAQTYMIGDHYTDLEAGRRANCRKVFVTYGLGKTMGETFDLQAASFPELVSKLTVM
jgi:phosphoglycolate phosphatase